MMLWDDGLYYCCSLVFKVGIKPTNEAGGYAAASHNAHRYLFLCVSQPEISGVRTIRPQSQQKWRRGGVRSGELFLLLTYCSSSV